MDKLASDSNLASRGVRQTTCEVCGDVVRTPFAHRPHSLNAASQIICNSVICKQIASKRDSASPQFYQRRVDSHRKLKQSQREQTAREFRRTELLRQKLRVQNEAAHSLAETQLPQLSAKPRLINIPTGRSKLSKLSSDRIKKYRERLLGLITKASEYSNLDEVSDRQQNEVREKAIRVDRMLEKDSKLKVVSDQLCTICKGGCCASGDDHAYLSVSTVRRFMDNNPTLSPKQVLVTYLEKLSPYTMGDSCINQTRRGCGLPRQMRSDNCNFYYCREIHEFHEAVVDPNSELTSDRDVIAIQRDYVHWDRECENACRDVTSASVLQSENVTELDISNLQ